MLIYSAISQTLLRRWFGLVRDRSDHLASSRYLVLGPELARLLELPEPSAAAVAELLRDLRDRDPEVLAYARYLARNFSPGREALLELRVDELVDATYEWHHPSQVLERPRPENRELLPICERRHQETGDDEREHVDTVTRKVARAARIDAEARLRRERLRRGRRRSRR